MSSLDNVGRKEDSREYTLLALGIIQATQRRYLAGIGASTHSGTERDNREHIYITWTRAPPQINLYSVMTNGIVSQKHTHTHSDNKSMVT